MLFFPPPLEFTWIFMNISGKMQKLSVIFDSNNLKRPLKKMTAYAVFGDKFFLLFFRKVKHRVFDKPGDKFAHMMDWNGGLKEKDKKEKARPIFLFQKNVPFVIAAVINMVVFPLGNADFPHISDRKNVV